ncbi:DUF192 domain-containing protein [Natronorubrum daqingense]|uniref:DUF192 domain-containing protein n=1 Tax=Natronorubrum daqingense TaxID=588898 RepID=A0A1N7D719_9EURY|nr:DUF192 domain-containing protein [Natronorubrum daqingense]APX97253.1 hypothetical protein BB347_11850 [Natronorubrum daqingense]SIR71650.1 hypothetical protein SAMN05421809_2110 [Natronorubrum daqingense]
MVLESVWKALLVVVAVSLLGFVSLQLGFLDAPWHEDRADVQLIDGDDGDELATVDAEVADTASERYTGLSDHDSLEDDSGMLFVHSDEGERTYVMRDMDFGIDIIFVDADGEITSIETAPEPEADEAGEDHEYTGHAQWVLEVPEGYADEHGIEAGDEIEIEYE